MTRDSPEPFLAAYAESGYVLGTSAYTCCRNCARQANCPGEIRGTKCHDDNHSCHPCTRWNRKGCRYFVLDWSMLKV